MVWKTLPRTSTTVCRFRNILVEADLYDRVLDEINRQLESRGVVVRRGAIIDASITDTPRRPPGRKAYEVVTDREEEDGKEASEKAMLKEITKPNVDAEARWVKKAGKLHFGYKRHTVTDVNGLILAEETTSANESDIKHFEAPLKKAKLPKGAPVFADKGYDSAENRKTLSRMKLKSRIMHRGTRAHKITEREQRVNVAISRIRYKVRPLQNSPHKGSKKCNLLVINNGSFERVEFCRGLKVERTFGSIHRWFRSGVARYVGLAKTHAQHMMEAMAYNLYRAPRIIVSNSLK